ncbi:hypothetical protein BD770DRAFT_376970 [Pilaira anomala]|nr:hypothetical protein BD770DRAFT_376970 [Pilaira anomala]
MCTVFPFNNRSRKYIDIKNFNEFLFITSTSFKHNICIFLYILFLTEVVFYH